MGASESSTHVMGCGGSTPAKAPRRVKENVKCDENTLSFNPKSVEVNKTKASKGGAKGAGDTEALVYDSSQEFKRQDIKESKGGTVSKNDIKVAPSKRKIEDGKVIREREEATAAANRAQAHKEEEEARRGG